MRRFVSLYGASPLHLLALLASFALAGYAALELFSSDWLGVAVWFAGAAVLHDLLLLPLYALADNGLVRAWHDRHRLPATLHHVPWINYLRVPLAVSALLLLVFFPSILRLSDGFETTTALSSGDYLERWLLITGALFVGSAVAFAVHLRRFSRVQAASTSGPH